MSDGTPFGLQVMSRAGLAALAVEEPQAAALLLQAIVRCCCIHELHALQMQEGNDIANY